VGWGGGEPEAQWEGEPRICYKRVDNERKRVEAETSAKQTRVTGLFFLSFAPEKSKQSEREARAFDGMPPFLAPLGGS
jgi:hypothetical protein